MILSFRLCKYKNNILICKIFKDFFFENFSY
nr:MAG TPA: hypothetical protein [Bacteriophage sp.]